MTRGLPCPRINEGKQPELKESEKCPPRRISGHLHCVQLSVCCIVFTRMSVPIGLSFMPHPDRMAVMQGSGAADGAKAVRVLPQPGTQVPLLICSARHDWLPCRPAFGG